MPNFYAYMRTHYYFSNQVIHRVTFRNRSGPNVLNIVTRMLFVSKSFDNYEFNTYICKRILY